LVGDERKQSFAAKKSELERGRKLLEAITLTPNEAERHGIQLNRDGVRRSGVDLLAHPSIDIATLAKLSPDLAAIRPTIAAQIETDAKYAVYLDRQNADIEALRRDEAIRLPDDLDYELSGLSNELREKLRQTRPGTLGQASRVEGMTPAALTLLLAETKKRVAKGRDAA
jgi:tRNA uridine 5-carboxymethylaminomethyl modification enzyme